MTVNHRVVGSSPTRGAITDRVIDTIYQLLYRFFYAQKTSFQADVLSMRVHLMFCIFVSVDILPLFLSFDMNI